MKVLITGAEGLLGQAVTRAMNPVSDVLALGHSGMDVINVGRVFDMVSKFRPHVVVHCAAFTDVDKCEQEVTRAFETNAMGAQNLALACLEHNAAMAYISCDSIFDGGSQTPYWEYDYPNPLSIYGKSKLAGERSVTQHLARFWIIRTGWLFGKSPNSFISTILNLAAGGREIKAVADQFGSPTYTADLAVAIRELIKSPFYGIYHITNSGVCSWQQFGQEILEAAGIEGIAVEPVSAADLTDAAPRPPHAVLNNAIHQLRGFTPLRSYREAMMSCLKDAGKLATTLS